MLVSFGVVEIGIRFIDSSFMSISPAGPHAQDLAPPPDPSMDGEARDDDSGHQSSPSTLRHQGALLVELLTLLASTDAARALVVPVLVLLCGV